MSQFPAYDALDLKQRRFPTDAVLAVMSEAEKVSEYVAAVRAGWSDYEALATIWGDA